MAMINIFVYILIATFIINYLVYARNISTDNLDRNQENYFKLFPTIWLITTVAIPLLSSGFLEPFFFDNISYFGFLWIWYLLIGIILIVVSIRLYSLASRLVKEKRDNDENILLITGGIFKIMRFPYYVAWILLYLGLVFILDSFLGIIFAPLYIVVVVVRTTLEEKYLYLPKFGKQYEAYMERTKFRLFPQPYNYVLIFIALITAYIGFFNLFLY